MDLCLGFGLGFGLSPSWLISDVKKALALLTVLDLLGFFGMFRQVRTVDLRIKRAEFKKNINADKHLKMVCSKVCSE